MQSEPLETRTLKEISKSLEQFEDVHLPELCRKCPIRLQAMQEMKDSIFRLYILLEGKE